MAWLGRFQVRRRPITCMYAEGYALTYRVTDVDGDAVTLRFTIAVNGIPSFGAQVVGRPAVHGGRGGELRVAGGGRWECGVDVFLGWGVASGAGV